MKSPSSYIGFAAAGTALFFGILIADSIGLFDGGWRVSRPAASNPSKAARASVKKSIAQPEPSRKDVERKPSARGSGGDLLEQVMDENERLRAANGLLEKRLSSVLNWILVNFRGKYPLPEPLVSKLRVDPMTEEYLLNPELGEMLKITGEEEAQINDVFAYARNYLHEIEMAVISVTNPRPDKVILHIPPFVEAGQALQDDLYGALEATLGVNRFDRFLTVSEEKLKESFYQFGEASRTMVFELVYVDGDPYPQLRIKDGYVIELGGNQRSVTATESVVTNLPSKYFAYMAWLPDYMAGYAAQ